MELDEVLRLIDKFDSSTLSRLTLALGADSVRLDRFVSVVPSAATVPSPTLAAAVSSPEPLVAPVPTIRAPLVGVFYAASTPGAPAFAPVGARVEQGQTVCILEAMKMMSEIPAPFACVIEEVLAENGALVGFDEPLFRVREA